MSDEALRAILDELAAPADRQRPDWDDVVTRSGRTSRRNRRSRAALVSQRRLIGVAAALAVGVGIALVGTWNRSPTVVENALAAVGDGPVVHAVFRYAAGTRVEIASGAESAIYRDVEVWYDQRSHTYRSIIRRDDELVSEQTGRALIPLLQPPLGAAAFYRQALAEGRAREVGTGNIRGRAVTWLEVTDPRRTMRVAVDSETFAVVVIETQTGGRVEHRLRVLQLETVSRDDARLGRPAEDEGGVGLTEGADASVPLTVADARVLFSEPPLWAGPRVVGRELTAMMRSAVTVQRDGDAPIEMTVFRLSYGGPARSGGIEIEEARFREADAAWRAQGYVAPPPGYVDITGAETPSGTVEVWTGRMQRGGFYIRVDAPSKEAVVAVARSMTRIE